MNDIVQTLDDIFADMDKQVTLINSFIQGPKSFKSYQQINAFIEHLEQMMEKDYVKNAGRSLTSYTDAISKAKTFMGL